MYNWFIKSFHLMLSKRSSIFLFSYQNLKCFRLICILAKIKCNNFCTFELMGDLCYSIQFSVKYIWICHWTGFTLWRIVTRYCSESFIKQSPSYYLANLETKSLILSLLSTSLSLRLKFVTWPTKSNLPPAKLSIFSSLSS